MKIILNNLDLLIKNFNFFIFIKYNLFFIFEMDIKQINNQFIKAYDILNELLKKPYSETENNKDKIIDELKIENFELIQKINELKEENNKLKTETLLLKTKNLKLINDLEESEKKLQIIKNTIQQGTIFE